MEKSEKTQVQYPYKWLFLNRLGKVVAQAIATKNEGEEVWKSSLKFIKGAVRAVKVDALTNKRVQ